jgi:hypothetical protein
MTYIAGSLAGEISALLDELSKNNGGDIYIEEDCFEIFRANAGRIGLLGSCAKDVASFYSEVKKLYHKKKDGKVLVADIDSVQNKGKTLKPSLETLSNRCYIGWLFCR